ncbi:PKD domain-containing protein [Candidatus Gracilibacteria bacterium]|nr:PKD domain-containing protein [Candidatus Gracilibacteria bacterium]
MDENKNPTAGSDNNVTPEVTPSNIPPTAAPYKQEVSEEPIINAGAEVVLEENGQEEKVEAQEEVNIPAPIIPSINGGGASVAEEEEEPEELESDANEPPSTPPKDLMTANADDDTGIGAGKLLKWFFIFALILVGIFYLVLLWGLLGGNVSNPLFEALGIHASDLKDTLLTVTNSIFGFLALIFLIGTLVKFFQWLIVGKNAANRREFLVKSGVFLGFFIVICGIWIGMYWLITNTDVAKVDPSGKKVTDSITVTNPENVIGLTAPVTVEFDIGQNLFEQIDKKLIRQISWDFDGDGEIDASGPKVSHRFLNKGKNNGRFLVNATVNYFSPASKEERVFVDNKEVIIANEAVMAQFSATPESGAVPLEVIFSPADSLDPDGEIVLYEWDLDADGSYEIVEKTPVEIKKTFPKVGDFVVKLRVTGANYDTAEIEKIIVVQESDNLQAKITSNKAFEGLPPYEIELNGERSFSRFGKIIRYEWLVEGEEEPVFGRNIIRTFRKLGDYTVTLTVENDLGEKNQVEQVIRVSDQKVEVVIKTSPKAEIGKPLMGKVPFEVEFDASSSKINNAIEWQWDFNNDGIVDSSTQKVTYTFREAGDYEVKLTIVSADEKEYGAKQKVSVERAGVNAKVIAEPIAGVVPLIVSFDASGSSADKGEIVDFSWEFPDQEGSVNYGAKLSYEFRRVGTFPVKLRILTSNQESDEETVYVTVRAHPLKASFEAFPSPGNGMNFQFDPRSSTGTVVDYFWNFGDGSTSREFMPTHTYGVPGEYKVSLKITDSKGVVSSTTQTTIAEK